MTVSKLISMKGKEKITMLTAYDSLFARILSDAGIDLMLVGDSMGTTVLGYNSTLPVSMEAVLHHTRAVRAGAPNAFIVADMPFLSYGITLEEGIRNAGRFIQEAGANAVKLEGGAEFAPLVEALNRIGIPVMGHIGLKPQSVLKSGMKIAGKTEADSKALLCDAKALETAGAFSLVLEGTTEEAAKEVTQSIGIPTIGIGAGKHTDGQVLVITDMLGLDPDKNFKHNKKYGNLYRVVKKSVKSYITEVKEAQFPSEEQTFHRV